jgi:hypothetical protein
MALAPSGGSWGGFQPDSGALADDDDNPSEQLRVAMSGYDRGRCGHALPVRYTASLILLAESS